MGNEDTRVKVPIALVTGGLVGSNLLSQLKADMINQNVFKAMFGNTGERIFVAEVPSYNETIFPLIEFYWGNEIYQDGDCYLTGNIKGRIILPSKLGTKTDINFQRAVANCIQRFLGSKKHNLFAQVKGLTEFGWNSEWLFDRLLPISAGLVVPAIDFTLPFKFDMTWLRRNQEDVDFDGDLDAALVGWLESIFIQVSDENGDVLIVEGLISETDQEN